MSRAETNLSTTAHDLKMLALSHHPVVVIETLEEERVRDLLAATTSDLGMPLFTWSVTPGLRRAGTDQPVYGTSDAKGRGRQGASLRYPARPRRPAASASSAAIRSSRAA